MYTMLYFILFIKYHSSLLSSIKFQSFQSCPVLRYSVLILFPNIETLLTNRISGLQFAKCNPFSSVSKSLFAIFSQNCKSTFYNFWILLAFNVHVHSFIHFIVYLLCLSERYLLSTPFSLCFYAIKEEDITLLLSFLPPYKKVIFIFTIVIWFSKRKNSSLIQYKTIRNLSKMVR